MVNAADPLMYQGKRVDQGGIRQHVLWRLLRR